MIFAFWKKEPEMDIQLSKNGWVYRIANAYSKDKQEETNLCILTRMIVLKLLLIIPLNILWFMFYYVIEAGIGGIIAFIFFGYRPVSFMEAKENYKPFGTYAPIDWWPEFRGKRIMLGAILGIPLAIASICIGLLIALGSLALMIYHGLMTHVLASKITTAVFISIVCLATSAIILAYAKDSE